ncbi:MBG domain-containing protein, partial [Billgrantia endophytica]
AGEGGYWTPIGNASNRFTGTFDGSGHVIGDLIVHHPDMSYVGLFGATGSASVIRDIGLQGGRVEGDEHVGALVGANGGTIERSYATGGVRGNNWDIGYIGGLVGANSGTITQSYATGNVWGYGNHAGGLVGWNDAGEITQSYATGLVTGHEKNVGGLVGANNGTITQSYATSSVLGNDHVGGLVGRNNGLITQSYATGSVMGLRNVGGLVGGTDASPSSVVDSFWDIERTGQHTSAGGEGRITAELQQMSTFAGWSISRQGGEDSVWRIYDGHTAPLLRAFLGELTLNVADASVTYDGTEQSGDAGWSIDGPYDASRLLGSGVVTGSGRNAGIHTLGMEGLYSHQQGYDLIVNEGTLTIDRAQATVTANSDTVVYDGESHHVTGFIVEGLVDGEDASVLTDITTSGGSGTNAGSYTHVVGGTADNYELIFVDGVLTVTPRSVTVTVDDQQKREGEADPALTWQAGCGSSLSDCGLVAGESLLGEPSREAGEGAGRYIIGQGSLTQEANPNYAIALIEGELTIVAIPPAPTPEPEPEPEPGPGLDPSPEPFSGDMADYPAQVSRAVLQRQSVVEIGDPPPDSHEHSAPANGQVVVDVEDGGIRLPANAVTASAN